MPSTSARGEGAAQGRDPRPQPGRSSSSTSGCTRSRTRSTSRSRRSRSARRADRARRRRPDDRLDRQGRARRARRGRRSSPATGSTPRSSTCARCARSTSRRCSSRSRRRTGCSRSRKGPRTGGWATGLLGAVAEVGAARPRRRLDRRHRRDADPLLARRSRTRSCRTRTRSSPTVRTRLRRGGLTASVRSQCELPELERDRVAQLDQLRLAEVRRAAALPQRVVGRVGVPRDRRAPTRSAARSRSPEQPPGRSSPSTTSLVLGQVAEAQRLQARGRRSPPSSTVATRRGVRLGDRRPQRARVASPLRLRPGARPARAEVQHLAVADAERLDPALLPERQRHEVAELDDLLLAEVLAQAGPDRLVGALGVPARACSCSAARPSRAGS